MRRGSLPYGMTLAALGGAVCAATLPPAQAPGDRCAAGRRSYARRKPEESVLYHVVQDELATFPAAASRGSDRCPAS